MKYTLEQAAAHTGYSYGYLRLLVQYGKIPSTKVAKNRILSQETVDRLKAKRAETVEGAI